MGDEPGGGEVPRRGDHLARGRLQHGLPAGEDFERYESLPEWARATLAKHAKDPRPHLYSLAEFEAGATHDELWNAAQGQLVSEGRIHNYLRMLWGKKVLEWSAAPREALGDPDRAQQQVRPGRPRSQLLQRHLLVPRPLRPPLGAGAAGLRHRPLHELGQHAPEVQGGRLCRAVRAGRPAQMSCSDPVGDVLHATAPVRAPRPAAPPRSGLPSSPPPRHATAPAPLAARLETYCSGTAGRSPWPTTTWAPGPTTLATRTRLLPRRQHHEGAGDDGALPGGGRRASCGSTSRRRCATSSRASWTARPSRSIPRRTAIPTSIRRVGQHPPAGGADPADDRPQLEPRHQPPDREDRRLAGART